MLSFLHPEAKVVLIPFQQGIGSDPNESYNDPYRFVLIPFQQGIGSDLDSLLTPRVLFVLIPFQQGIGSDLQFRQVLYRLVS